MGKYPIPLGRHLLLLERINVGGMAEVFRAKTFGVEGFERVVAIKRILPSLAEDDEFITMFVDEARIAAHLTHQNIVQIYELGKNDGTYFITMEYVAGLDLRQILDRQKRLGTPMDPTLSSFVVARVCEALDYAHRKRDPAGRDLGIIHRDVTPQNVIVSYQGEVKLCDFGIAKAATRVSRTQVGVLKGKFAYMAPEQVRGQPVDRRGDIFALGVIFYEMLTGERLFIGDSDYATLEAVRSAEIPPPSSIRPELSVELENVIMKMLARDPEERYAWASEVHDDLSEAIMATGRLYQNRHLRDWMQQTYASAIEAENAKMEAFMKLRPPSVEATDRITKDPKTKQDPDSTADYPALPSEVLDALNDTETVDGPREQDTQNPAALRTAGRLGESPVSNLFGTPHVEDSGQESDKEALMVRPAGASEVAETAAAVKEDAADERTVFDQYAPVDDNETVLGDPVPESVSEAQDEIRELLEDPIESSLDALPNLDDVHDSTTVGGENTQHGIFVPQAADDDADRTSVQSHLPAATVESVFAVDQDTPIAGVQALQADRSDTPEVGGSQLGGAAQVALDGERTDEPLPQVRTVRPRSILRSAPVREVNAPSVVGPLPPPIPAERAAGSKAGVVVSDDGFAARRPFENLTSPAPEDALPAAVSRVTPVGRAAANFGRPALILVTVGIAVLSLATIVVVLQPRQASLKVLSKPIQGAEVYIDGQLVGKTPVRVGELTLGRHRVQLEASGYRQYTQTIRIQARRPHTMMVPLEARPPETALPLPAGNPPLPADDERAESPPVDKPKPAVSPGQGSMLITTRPSGVRVLVDGIDTGLRTPVRKPYVVTVGRHTLTFLTDDGRRYDFTVRVPSGAEPVRVDQSLQ